MEYKVIAGNLTAHVNFHGTHLENYLNNKVHIAKIFSEELMLHDQINIPIPDYLTACGLLVILGEHNFISLLESNQIRFIKYNGQLTFLKSIDKEADFGISRPQPPHPWSSPIDVSLDISLNFLEERYPLRGKTKLKELLIKQTDLVDIGAHLDQIRSEVFETFSYTSVSKKPFNDYLKDPVAGKVNAQVLGDSPTNYENPISLLISLMNLKFETNLKEQFECQNVSPTSEVNNLLGLTNNQPNKFWEITELYDIPNLGGVILSGEEQCQSLIKLSRSAKAADFREWFQSNSDKDIKELRRELIGLVDNEPWFKRTYGSYICWGTVVLTGITYGPLAGVPLSLLNKLLGKIKGRSPKYFIYELEKLKKD